MITTLALLHRDKLQRIHDAPPDSTTGLLQQVIMLSAASGWERGKTWKEWEGIGRIGKNMKITLLRVIPTMTSIRFVTGISSGILSDISSGILSGISSAICSGISSGKESEKTWKQRIPDPSSSSLILNIRQLPFQLTLGSRPHRDLPRSAEFSDSSDSPAQAHWTIWTLFVTHLPWASIGTAGVTVMLGINATCRIL